jgi:hypothetical protein
MKPSTLLVSVTNTNRLTAIKNTYNLEIKCRFTCNSNDSVMSSLLIYDIFTTWVGRCVRIWLYWYSTSMNVFLPWVSTCVLNASHSITTRDFQRKNAAECLAFLFSIFGKFHVQILVRTPTTLNDVFVGSSILQGKTGRVTSIRPRKLPSIYVIIHYRYSLIKVPFGGIQSD